MRIHHPRWVLWGTCPGFIARAKTEKGGCEWLKILDAAGARKMNHTEIAT